MQISDNFMVWLAQKPVLQSQYDKTAIWRYSSEQVMYGKVGQVSGRSRSHLYQAKELHLSFSVAPSVSKQGCLIYNCFCGSTEMWAV